jgi:hypothetical protein
MTPQKVLQRSAFPRRVSAGARHLRETELGLRRQLSALGSRVSIQALGSSYVSKLLQLHLGRGHTRHARLHAVGINLDQLQV